MTTTAEIFWRLLLANLCGALIGTSRDPQHKSAGFRTFSMVCVGSAIVALIVQQMSPDPNAASRVIQGVVTGVGSLGAGILITLRILLIGKPIEKMVERFVLQRDGGKIPAALEAGPPQTPDADS